MSKTGIPSQIIGSFEDIGKDILRETINVPKDIAGKALESLGTSSGKTQGQQAPQAATADKPKEGPLAELDQAKDTKVKEAIARRALEELSGNKPKQKEPSVWERIQMEVEQKKKQQQQQTIVAAQSALPMAKSKRPRGDLYGVKAKRNAAEVSRNVRQD